MNATPLERPEVIAALERYRAELATGMKPDRETLIGRFPDAAAELTKCLDAIEFVHAAIESVPSHMRRPH